MIDKIIIRNKDKLNKNINLDKNKMLILELMTLLVENNYLNKVTRNNSINHLQVDNLHMISLTIKRKVKIKVTS